MAKRTGGGTGKNARIEGTAANVNIFVAQATSSATYQTNDNFWSTGAWTFIAWTYDSGAAPRIHIYHATLTGALTESTYGLSANGSGDLASDSGQPLLVEGFSRPNTNFNGHIAWFTAPSPGPRSPAMFRWPAGYESIVNGEISRRGSCASGRLENALAPVFQHTLHFAEELVCHGAVHHAVVVA